LVLFNLNLSPTVVAREPKTLKIGDFYCFFCESSSRTTVSKKNNKNRLDSMYQALVVDCW
jgi:hypothetical protein